ncbi:MAG: CCA tRNA nucleotidyltransferase [Hyphomicrobiaceae bacterium]
MIAKPVLGDLTITPVWLQHPALIRVIDALEGCGHGVRVVGGAIRDHILGLDTNRSQTDVDLATTAQPDETIAAAFNAGLAALPTGIAHGTVTVRADGHAFEVTTLRADVETDGRHALVQFTDDWAIDARRRDFTVNALSCDRHGRVYDAVGGLADLAQRQLRFVGSADDRMTEDYLRILRLFRFIGHLDGFTVDLETYQSATRHRAGLARLSRERIGQEMRKLFSSVNASGAVRAMIEHGIWFEVLGYVPTPGLLEQRRAIEDEGLCCKHAPLGRLLAAAHIDCTDVERVASALRLSRHDTIVLQRALQITATLERDSLTEASLKQQIYRTHRDRHPAASEGVTLGLVHFFARHAADTTPGQRAELASLVACWRAPVFPVSGGDLMALGYVPGPEMGARLREIEERWIASGFELDRDALIAGH